MEQRALPLICGVRRRESRLDKSPTTEDWCDEIPEFLGTKGIRLPEKLFQLRQKLYLKAKRESQFRFYALYGLIQREDVLKTAWRVARSRKGAAGFDGVTFEQIEKQEGGIERFLSELSQELKMKTYHAKPVKRVYIPKANGGQRPLGIPVIRDRVVQTALLLIVEPIFEADFQNCSYGFRPERSCKDALGEIRKNIEDGRTAVYDADLKSYFDTIPHEKLMACIKMRISDGSVLNLIRMWLNAPVEDYDERGKKRITRPKQGTPQGGVISPLLANLYLHWFDKVFNDVNGPATWANARLVRYADDFVVMAKYVGGRVTNYVEEKVEGWLGLSINREKTRCVKLHERGSSLDFLGFTFRYARDLGGRAHQYLVIEPSKKAQQRERDRLREMTDSGMCFKPVTDMITEINQHLLGWSNYFSYGYPRKAFRNINWYVRKRLTRHLQRRSQRPMRPPRGTSFYKHLQNLGLMYL
jgi:RNA-directed DNA polymerase